MIEETRLLVLSNNSGTHPAAISLYYTIHGLDRRRASDGNSSHFLAGVILGLALWITTGYPSPLCVFAVFVLRLFSERCFFISFQHIRPAPLYTTVDSWEVRKSCITQDRTPHGNGMGGYIYPSVLSLYIIRRLAGSQWLRG